MTTDDLYRFIASHDLAVLGTTSSADTPECALVGIAVTPSLEIVFDTVNTSRKYRNLMHRPSAAFVIGWENEITLQYEGEAHEPSGADLERFQQVYFATWPTGAIILSGSASRISPCSQNGSVTATSTKDRAALSR